MLNFAISFVYFNFYYIFAFKILTILCMEKILYEKEVCSFLDLPSIPKKIHDGESGFTKGVAVVKLLSGLEAYAVATFDPEKNEKPIITKVFSGEQFTEITRIYVVPDYMNVDDIKNADLDTESKKKAEEIINEAKEIEDDGAEVTPLTNNDNPYFFDFIHNDDEAVAFIESWNKKNKIHGNIPKKHETILMRLAVIYSESNKMDK